MVEYIYVMQSAFQVEYALCMQSDLLVQYQTSVPGSIDLPHAMLNCLQNPKWPPGGPKLANKV